MDLLGYQESIADRLDTNEALRKGGCKAMAEDSLAIDSTLKKQMLTLKGIALVVTTPTVNKIGASVPGWMPVELPDLTISCVEMPKLNRSRSGAITSLKAAQLVAALFDGPKCSFLTIQQSADETTGAQSASAIFRTTTMLSTSTPT